MSEQSGVDILPTILDPATCVKKGLCTVAHGRAVQTHQLYYELHGTLDASQKMLFSASCLASNFLNLSLSLSHIQSLMTLTLMFWNGLTSSHG